MGDCGITLCARTMAIPMDGRARKCSTTSEAKCLMAMTADNITSTAAGKTGATNGIGTSGNLNVLLLRAVSAAQLD